MLPVQATATEAERWSRTSCAVTFCRALKTGHFNTRLDFTERVNQVLHSKQEKAESIARETGHVRTIRQAKPNILGSTFTGTQEMNICFTSTIYGTLQYSNDF